MGQSNVVDLTSLHIQREEEPKANDHQTPDVHVALLPPTPTAQRYTTSELEAESTVDISPSPSPRAPATSLRRGPSDEILGHYDEGSESDDELALGQVARAAAYISNAGNPNSYREARNSPQWEQWEAAIQEELDTMEKYQVFKVIPRQPNMHVLKARWVFTRKIDGETGKTAAFKARWVAKGYAQIEGIHFNDIHASVVHKDSIRVLLALVSY